MDFGTYSTNGLSLVSKKSSDQRSHNTRAGAASLLGPPGVAAYSAYKAPRGQRARSAATTGGGALAGGVAGQIAGSRLGGPVGRAAGSIAGTVGGAVAGSNRNWKKNRVSKVLVPVSKVLVPISDAEVSKRRRVGSAVANMRGKMNRADSQTAMSVPARRQGGNKPKTWITDASAGRSTARHSRGQYLADTRPSAQPPPRRR